MKKLTVLGATFAVAMAAAPTLAQGGDLCSNPQVVLGPGPVTVDTNAATTELHHASCDMRSGTTWYNAVDVWYSYTAQITGIVEARLSGCSSTITSSTASNLSLWSSCSATDSTLCARTACNSLISFPITAGQSYLVRATTFAISSSSSSAARRGTATLTFTEQGPPANDTCAAALDITTGATAWNDSLALPHGPLPTCTDLPAEANQRDLFYAFTPPNGGVLQLTSTGAWISVHTACGGPSIYCASGTVTGPVAGGTRYLIRIARPAASTAGPGTLTVGFWETPSNDTCDTAREVGPGEHTWDDSGALADAPFPSCGLAATPAQRDVWFAYTASSTSTATFDARVGTAVAPGTNTQATITLFSACNGTELACVSSSGVPRWICRPMQQGERIYVRVARAESSAREPWLLNIAEHLTPAGDSCSTASPLFLGTQSFGNHGACDTAPNEAQIACYGSQYSHASTWYIFVPDTNGVAVFSTASGTVNTLLAAYSDCNGTLIDCSNDLSPPATLGSHLAVPAQAGVPIYLRGAIITTANNYYQNYTLTTDLIDPISNDECATATVVSAPGSFPYDNRNATDSPNVPDPTCNIGGNLGRTRHDLWYDWTAPQNGTTRITTCWPAPLLSGYATVLSVYTGCDLTTQVACNDDATDAPGFDWALPCNDEQSAVSFPSQAGSRFLIRMGGHSEWIGPGVFKLDFVPNTCTADFNNSGDVTVQDIFDFLAAYFSGLPSADFNNAGGITVQDIFDYLAAYFAGCP